MNFETRPGSVQYVPRLRLVAQLVTRWGSRKLSEIKRRDMRDLLEETAERAPAMANRALALVRKMFNFAIERERIESNPCHRIKRPAPERPRVLSEDEIRRLWKALGQEHPILRRALWPAAAHGPARRGSERPMVGHSTGAQQERACSSRAAVAPGRSHAAAATMFVRLSWWFDWGGTATGFSTAGLIFVVAPLLALLIGSAGLAEAWLIHRATTR